jgi:hypothetical protein
MNVFERQSLNLIWVMLIIAGVIAGFFLGQSQASRFTFLNNNSSDNNTVTFQANPSLQGPLSAFQIETVTLHGTITKVDAQNLTLQSQNSRTFDLALAPSVAVLTRTAGSTSATTSFDKKAIPTAVPVSVSLSFTANGTYEVSAVSYFERLLPALQATNSAKPKSTPTPQ